MQIRKLLSAYKNKILPKRLKLEEVIVLGKTLNLYEGTSPKNIDKDDAWFLALANRHDIIYDIGSNLGYSSILSSIGDPQKNIVLVDPNKMVLKYAEENMQVNTFSANKIFICCFAGDKTGEKIKFYTLGTGAAGSMFGSHAVSAKAVNAWDWVDTKSLDDIVTETGKTPDLVKIDVEAAEYKTLLGAEKLAGKQQAKFFVEMHAPPEMPMLRNAGLVLNWCEKNQYTAYYLREHCKLTDANMIADRGRCHLLLLPAGSTYPDYLKGIKENDPLDSVSI